MAEMTAEQLCRIWGLWTAGGSFRTAGFVVAGIGTVGLDEGAAVATYVETTPGFVVAKPALLVCYRDGASPTMDRFRGPGEGLTRALLRLRWGGFLGYLPSQIPDLVIAEFLRSVESRQLLDPFVRPMRVNAPDHLEVADAASRDLAQKIRHS